MERVHVSVTNALEELGIFASVNVVVSIEVRLLGNVGNDVHALGVSLGGKALNVAYEAIVSG